jgi:hypothetical protein
MNIYSFHLGREVRFWWQKIYGCQHSLKGISAKHAFLVTTKAMLRVFKLETEMK